MDMMISSSFFGGLNTHKGVSMIGWHSCVVISFPRLSLDILEVFLWGDRTGYGRNRDPVFASHERGTQ